MAANSQGTLLAIGCEDGCVRLYSILPSSFSNEDEDGDNDDDDRDAILTVGAGIMDQKLEYGTNANSNTPSQVHPHI